MSRTIKRGPPPRRPAGRTRQPPKPSLGDRILAWSPVSEAALRKAATWSILGVAGAGAIAAAIWAGVPAMVGNAIADGAGRAGLRVAQIDITGLKRMDRETVYAVALDQQSRVMPSVDLAAVRRKLLRYGWIADAQVSRRLPDTLLVNIVEREPAAIWQNQGRLTLIDKHGVLLDPVDPDRIPDLPLVIGPGAHRQEARYQRLLAAAPSLGPRVRAASWVGNRRWDLLFDTGETLALPQEGAERALVTFARMDGARPLLGKGWVRFDMRDPTRLVARKPGQYRDQATPNDGVGVAPAATEIARTERI